MDWSTVRYFTKEEMACSCGCGRADMDPDFMAMLDELREQLGRPLTITSAFRCRNHLEEIKKALPGAHSAGYAADIAVSGGSERFQVMQAAIKMGFVGIGVARGFVHVDLNHPHAVRPAAWSY